MSAGATSPFSLSAFGSIAAGESVIITDLSEADFRTVWSGLAAEVRVLGGATPGLGRNDSIRIFDDADTLVDILDYGDETFAGSERFRRITAVTTFDNLGENDIYGWYFSNTEADLLNLTSINGDIGNPGYLNAAASAIPEPASFAAIFGALTLAGASLRRRPRSQA